MFAGSRCIVQGRSDKAHIHPSQSVAIVLKKLNLLQRKQTVQEQNSLSYNRTRMWANAQRDDSPAEYRWRPLFNAAVWLTPTTRVHAVTLPRRETR